MIQALIVFILERLARLTRLRARRRPGLAILLLLVGGCCGMSACATLAFGVPASWQRLWEVRGMQRPQPAGLDALASGTRVLIDGRLLPVAEVAQHGLTLFYIERMVTSPSSSGTATMNGSWELSQPPPAQARITLAGGRTLMLDLTEDTEFLDARTVQPDKSNGGSGEVRYTGYARDTLLTAEGVSRGEGRLSVRALYPGSVDDYLGYRASMPWIGMATGLLCCFAALGLIGAGGVLWFFRR
jgi:hypothetical protein